MINAYKKNLQIKLTNWSKRQEKCFFYNIKDINNYFKTGYFCDFTTLNFLVTFCATCIPASPPFFPIPLVIPLLLFLLSYLWIHEP